METEKYIFMLLPVVGVGFLWGGIVYGCRLRRTIETFVFTQGTVLGYNTRVSNHGGGGLVYHLVVEYQVNNTSYSVQSEHAYGKPKEKEGSNIGILYDPKDPSNAHVRKDYYTSAQFMMAMGILGILFGVLFIYHMWGIGVTH